MALRQPDDTPHPMSEDDYLAFEAQSEIKHEYIDGHIRAMTGASWNHGRLCINMSTILNVALDDTDCEVVSDVRLRVQSEHVSYRYPDVMVTCDEPQLFKNRVDTITNPIMLVEVLSDSTQAIDYSDKLAEYTRIETLQAYILVAQNRVKVGCFMRQPDGNWTYQLLQEQDAVLRLPFLECDVPLEQLYRKVNFDLSKDTEPDNTDTP